MLQPQQLLEGEIAREASVGLVPSVVVMSDECLEVEELLPSFPRAAFAVKIVSLKKTIPDELKQMRPAALLIDGTLDVDAAAKAITRLAGAHDLGFPAIILVTNEDMLALYPFEARPDDFIVDTASAPEIGTRLWLASRRGKDETSIVHCGEVTINVDSYQVHVGERRLDLAYKEFELLRFLAERAGRVCDRQLLLREVWGYDFYGGTRTVDVHIRRLRAKLGTHHHGMIKTIRNVGYMLLPD
ncbi:MAG TPA: winged helix-turn-helix domain-containing protein [Actinomycetota bacterium]|nr:winged helix-turn-helix domain-containing protein [Actinomycetota bacterium]